MNSENKQRIEQLRRALLRDFAFHRGRQPAVDRASGHARGWTREALTRPVFKLTGYQLLSCARGMGLDLGELLNENTKPDPAELLRKVREATHGKRQDTLAKLPTIKTKSKIETQSGKTKAAAEGGAETAETKSEATKIVLKTPPSAILRLQSAARQVACNRLDPAQAQQHSAPTTEEAFACLLHAPLNHRRQVLRVEPRWRSLAGVKSAALAIDKLRLRAPEDAIARSLCANVSETLKYREISEGVESNHHGESKPRAARYGC